MKISHMAGVAALGVTLSLSGPAQAGGLAEPILEPEVIAEESNSTQGFILPLILLAVIAGVLIATGGDDGGGGSI
ncbi:MAG: hypothetical protein AAF871_08975 [Pseudomonadota bacterium]